MNRLRAISREAWIFFGFLLVVGAAYFVGRIGTSPVAIVPHDVRLVHSLQFSANDEAVVFPLAIDRRTTGLIFYDRLTGKKSIISEPGTYFEEAYLSNDGRMLLVKTQGDISNILDCEIGSWRCRSRLKTENAISSLVRTNGDRILFSASPPILVGGRKRFGDFDIFLLETHSSPRRLTNFGLYALDAIGLARNRIIFTAAGTGEREVLEHPFPIAGLSSSQIYALEYDPISFQVEIPEKKLKPLFQFAGGVSSHAAVSADGSLVAFMYGGPIHTGVAIATADGKLLKILETKEGEFSRPAITGTEVITNELWRDRFILRTINRSTLESTLNFKIFAEISTQPDEVNRLDRIKLDIVSD
jgi:hypothetical protein